MAKPRRTKYKYNYVNYSMNIQTENCWGLIDKISAFYAKYSYRLSLTDSKTILAMLKKIEHAGKRLPDQEVRMLREKLDLLIEQYNPHNKMK